MVKTAIISILTIAASAACGSRASMGHPNNGELLERIDSASIDEMGSAMVEDMIRMIINDDILSEGELCQEADYKLKDFIKQKDYRSATIYATNMLRFVRSHEGEIREMATLSPDIKHFLNTLDALPANIKEPAMQRSNDYKQKYQHLYLPSYEIGQRQEME